MSRCLAWSRVSVSLVMVQFLQPLHLAVSLEVHASGRRLDSGNRRYVNSTEMGLSESVVALLLIHLSYFLHARDTFRCAGFSLYFGR